MSKTILMTASILLALAVAIGAYGAHGLKSHLSETMLQTYKTGVEYHFYHALGATFCGRFQKIAIKLNLKLLLINLKQDVIIVINRIFQVNFHQ